MKILHLTPLVNRFIFVVVLLILTCSSILSAGLELEINVFRKQLKSEPLQKLAEKQIDGLKSKDVEVRKAAVTFFADANAGRVIVELLDSEDHQDLITEKHIRVIGFECLERLYVVLHRSLPKRGAKEDLSVEKRVARDARLQIINRHVSKILGVESIELKEVNRDSFRDGWLQMLQTAKEKKTFYAPLDEILKNIEAVRMNEAAIKPNPMEKKDPPEKKSLPAKDEKGPRK